MAAVSLTAMLPANENAPPAPAMPPPAVVPIVGVVVDDGRVFLFDRPWPNDPREA